MGNTRDIAVALARSGDAAARELRAFIEAYESSKEKMNDSEEIRRRAEIRENRREWEATHPLHTNPVMSGRAMYEKQFGRPAPEEHPIPTVATEKKPEMSRATGPAERMPISDIERLLKYSPADRPPAVLSRGSR